MSITIELPDRLEKILQDEAERLGKTPGEIACEHLVALYDTRTDKEQAIDAHFAQEKARERAKRERLVADVLEDRRRKALAEQSAA